MRPWVLGRIPVITMSFVEHVLKHLSEFTMKIVMDEIKEINPEFFEELTKNKDHLMSK